MLKTLARLCTENGNVESLGILIENGCKTDFLVRYAVRSKQMDCLKYLIAKGYNLNESNSSTASALFASVTENLPEFAKVLLENGADASLLFKDQTLLSYAAKAVKPSFFKLLIQYGAPLSALPPAIPPLITALKKQQMNIVSTLLSLGADPDCYCLSKESKSLIYPLDIAFRIKSSAAMTLLLLSGARKNSINKEELDESMRSQFEEMTSVIKVREPQQLTRDLSLVFGQYKPIESSTKVLIEELRLVGEMNRILISQKLNKIRETFYKFTVFMPKLLEFSKNLDSQRLLILKKQFRLFEQDDKVKLSPIIQSSSKIWRSLLSQTVDLMNKNKSRSTIQKNQFIDFINTELKKKSDGLGEKIENILCFSNEGDASENSDANKNRELLAYFADILQQLKSLQKSIYDTINNLNAASCTFIDSAVLYISEINQKLNIVEESYPVIKRAGLSQLTLSKIKNVLDPRREMAIDSLKKLSENKKACEDLTELVKKCIRQNTK